MSGVDGLEAFSVYGDVSLRGGEQVVSGLSDMATKAAGFLASPLGMATLVVSAIVGVGIASVKASEEVKAAQNIIQGQTGATGVALQSMTKIAEKLSETTNAAFTDSASIVAQYSSQLHFTGKDLSNLSLKTAELAYVTGTADGTMAKSAANFFANWHLGAKAAGDSLEYLLIVSQRTGQAVPDLMDSLTKSGPILRSLGLGLHQSASLTGEIGRVMGSTTAASVAFRTVYTKLSTEVEKGYLVKPPKKGTLSGIDLEVNALGKSLAKNPSKGLLDIFAAIKNAPSTGAAGVLGKTFFGARSGMALVNEIRGSKDEYNKLTQTIAAPKTDVIGKQMQSQLTLGDAFGRFMKSIQVSMAPMGKTISDDLTSAFSNAARDLGKGNWLGAIGQVLNGLGNSIADILNGLFAHGSLAKLFSSWTSLWKGFSGGMGGALSGFWTAFVGIWNADWTHLWTWLGGLLTNVKTTVLNAWTWIRVQTQTWWANMWNTIVNAIGNLPHWLAGLGTSAWQAFSTALGQGISAISSAGQKLANALITAVKSFLHIASPSGVFAGIGGNIMDGLIKGLNAKDAMSIVKNMLGGVANVASDILGGGGGDAGLLAKFLGKVPAGDMNALQKGLGAAMGLVGKPYVWGASGPSADDCSGLVSYILSVMGFNYGRMTTATEGGMLAKGPGKALTVGLIPGVHTAIEILGNWFEAKGRKWGILGPHQGARSSWPELLHVPGFHTGGVSPGGLVNTLRGEGLFTPEQMAALGGGGAQPITMYIQLDGVLQRMNVKQVQSGHYRASLAGG